MAGQMLTDDQIGFTSDFASELLRINRTALHLYIDEADTSAPQMVESRAPETLPGNDEPSGEIGRDPGRWRDDDLATLADINKKVLSQVDILTVVRISHPLDIAAATDRIKSEVSPEFAREVGEALPSLPVGTASVCSASLRIGQRIEVLSRPCVLSRIGSAVRKATEDEGLGNLD